jgi:type I protein arginine methyltransferase
VLNLDYTSALRNSNCLRRDRSGSPGLQGRRRDPDIRATAHGLCLWFETMLHGALGFASVPGTPGNVYGQLFLPWLEPVALQEGESVHVSLRADVSGEDYVWQWETTMPASANPPAVHFRQSSFDGAANSAQSLHRQALD